MWLESSLIFANDWDPWIEESWKWVKVGSKHNAWHLRWSYYGPSSRIGLGSLTFINALRRLDVETKTGLEIGTIFSKVFLKLESLRDLSLLYLAIINNQRSWKGTYELRGNSGAICAPCLLGVGAEWCISTKLGDNLVLWLHQIQRKVKGWKTTLVWFTIAASHWHGAPSTYWLLAFTNLVPVERNVIPGPRCPWWSFAGAS